MDKNNFKDILEAIIKGFGDELYLETNANFNGYSVDYVIHNKIDDIDYICLLIKYDDDDEIRTREIVNFILKDECYDSDSAISTYTIKQGEELKAIKDIIIFLNYEPSLTIQEYKYSDVKDYYKEYEN